LKTASRRPEPTPRRIADGIGLHERIRHRLALPIGRSSSDTASLLIAKWAEQFPKALDDIEADESLEINPLYKPKKKKSK